MTLTWVSVHPSTVASNPSTVRPTLVRRSPTTSPRPHPQVEDRDVPSSTGGSGRGSDEWSESPPRLQMTVGTHRGPCRLIDSSTGGEMTRRRRENGRDRPKRRSKGSWGSCSSSTTKESNRLQGSKGTGILREARRGSDSTGTSCLSVPTQSLYLP